MNAESTIEAIEGNVVQGGRPVRIEIEDDRITAILSATTPSNVWLAPGFVDIQVNGYAQNDVNSAEATPNVIHRLVRSLWRRGVTSFCPTVITQLEERICSSLRAIADACATDPLTAHSIPCIHVEGPSISTEDGPRGAHPLEHVRSPSLDEYRRWQEASGGRVGIITLAPEHPGALEYIREVAADGVVVAIGHTAAAADRIEAAVGEGARLSTHLGNGAHASLPRHPNYIWEQLADDHLMASLICDGHHLPAAVVKTMIRAKGLERTILVSDAVAVGGSAPGTYTSSVGGLVELLPNGRLNLYGTPYLAGSTTSIPECISNTIRFTGTTLAEAVALATDNPARLLGLDTRDGRGALEAGAVADLTLFRWDEASGEITIEATIVAGQLVYQRKDEE